MIVAVSKQQSASAIDEAFRGGISNFGESYRAGSRAEDGRACASTITWHFIGKVQANKTRSVAERFAWVHTVDRLKSPSVSNEQRAPFAPPLNVLIQVNQGARAAEGRRRARGVAALARAIAASAAA